MGGTYCTVLNEVHTYMYSTVLYEGRNWLVCQHDDDAEHTTCLVVLTRTACNFVILT